MRQKKPYNLFHGQVAALFLTFALFFNAGGSHYYFLLMQSIVQFEMNNMKAALQLSDKDLELISFSESSKFKWHRDYKEFDYKGCRYDIISIVKNSRGSFYKCINDVKEKRLIAQNHKNTTRESKRIRYSLSSFVFRNETFSFEKPVLQRVILFKPNAALHYNSGDIPAPPPKMV